MKPLKRNVLLFSLIVIFVLGAFIGCYTPTPGGLENTYPVIVEKTLAPETAAVVVAIPTITSEPEATVNKIIAVPTVADDKKTIIVYVTNSGKKYHRDGCQYLRKSSIPISLADAKSEGYTPCSKCNPPE